MYVLVSGICTLEVDFVDSFTTTGKLAKVLEISIVWFFHCVVIRIVMSLIMPKNSEFKISTVRSNSIK